MREEDPSRLSTYASNHDNADPKNWHTDVVAFNRYFGWYGGQLADFAPWLDRTHADYPRARFAMSEFGAGASVSQHEENPARPSARGPFHPEEYQNLYHEAYWAALKGRPYVWAKFIWCLHDFASDGRNEGDHPGRNDKGLVTYDRKVRKDAFYFYKANWSSDPVLHIASCRFTDRTGPVTEIKVYSNAPEVTLEVNGASLGAAADPAGGRVFRWPGVTLDKGPNRVVATAHFPSAVRLLRLDPAPALIARGKENLLARLCRYATVGWFLPKFDHGFSQHRPDLQQQDRGGRHRLPR